MKTIPGVTLVLALALQAAAAGAGEGRPVDERRPVKADARVSVSNVAGLIEVEAWDKNELHLTGTLSEEVEKLEITGNDARLKIEVKLPERTRNVGDTVLRLKAPAGVTLSAEAVSGNVTVAGASGALRSESVSGDLRVEARAVRRLKAESVSGDVIVDLELAKGAEVSIESLSGDVQLALPRMPEGELEMETFSGDLESAWPPYPGDSRDYRYEGKGPGSVKLSSFSGDITLKKR